MWPFKITFLQQGFCSYLKNKNILNCEDKQQSTAQLSTHNTILSDMKLKNIPAKRTDFIWTLKLFCFVFSHAKRFAIHHNLIVFRFEGLLSRQFHLWKLRAQYTYIQYTKNIHWGKKWRRFVFVHPEYEWIIIPLIGIVALQHSELQYSIYPLIM